MRSRQPTGDEQRKLLADLWQMQQTQQQVGDGGSLSDDRDVLADADKDTFRARRISTWLRRSNGNNEGREMKKWNDFEEPVVYDAENLRSHYNVLDQIGSNIIRKK